jgi:hypothetical protein
MPAAGRFRRAQSSAGEPFGIGAPRAGLAEPAVVAVPPVAVNHLAVAGNDDRLALPDLQAR